MEKQELVLPHTPVKSAGSDLSEISVMSAQFLCLLFSFAIIIFYFLCLVYV